MGFASASKIPTSASSLFDRILSFSFLMDGLILLLQDFHLKCHGKKDGMKGLSLYDARTLSSP